MKRLWNRIPRGLRLAVDLLAILILLLSAWAMLDYPLWSREAAYRLSLEDAGYPALDSELQLETEYGLQYLASDGSCVYRSRIERENIGWRGEFLERCPLAEGVPYCSFDWNYLYGGESKVYDEELDAWVPRLLPMFAVKAEAAEAALRLTIGDGWTPRLTPEYPDGKAQLQGGSFQLESLETKNGWFVFGVNLAMMEDYSIPTIPQPENRNGYDHFYPPYDILALWMALYHPYASWNPDMEPESRLELTLFDEGGTVIRTVELPTHYGP